MLEAMLPKGLKEAREALLARDREKELKKLVEEEYEDDNIGELEEEATAQADQIDKHLFEGILDELIAEHKEYNRDLYHKYGKKDLPAE